VSELVSLTPGGARVGGKGVTGKGRKGLRVAGVGGVRRAVARTPATAAQGPCCILAVLVQPRRTAAACAFGPCTKPGASCGSKYQRQCHATAPVRHCRVQRGVPAPESPPSGSAQARPIPARPRLFDRHAGAVDTADSPVLGARRPVWLRQTGEGAGGTGQRYL
jgi:hypothetical protein